MKNIAKKILSLAALFSLVVGGQVFAASTSTQMSQAINQGTLDIEVVDSAGVIVPSPSVAFSSAPFSFDDQDTTAVLGTNDQRMRVYNPTNNSEWTVSVAALNPTDVWTDGATFSYDFNDGSGYADGADTDTVGGQLAVDPTTASIGVPDVKCNTTGISLGSASAFSEGSVDSVTVAVAGLTAKKFCRWDFTNVGLTQKIPGLQEAASYTLSLSLSVI